MIADQSSTRTAPQSAVPGTQEAALVITREPRFQRDFTAVGGGDTHRDPAQVDRDILRRGLAGRVVRQSQVRAGLDELGEVDIDVGQINLMAELGALGLEIILAGQGHGAQGEQGKCEQPSHCRTCHGLSLTDTKST